MALVTSDELAKDVASAEALLDRHQVMTDAANNAEQLSYNFYWVWVKIGLTGVLNTEYFCLGFVWIVIYLYCYIKMFQIWCLGNFFFTGASCRNRCQGQHVPDFWRFWQGLVGQRTLCQSWYPWEAGYYGHRERRTGKVRWHNFYEICSSSYVWIDITLKSWYTACSL